MRASVAIVLAATLFSTAPARADDPETSTEDPEIAAARDAGKLFFLGIANSEDSYLRSVMRAPVRYEHLAFEDPKCAKQFAGRGSVSKGRLARFATCVLALVRKQPAGELALSVSRPSKGVLVVSAANPEITFELSLVKARDGTYQVTGLKSPAVPAGTVAPPEVGDLDGYIADLHGKGALIATIATSKGTIHCELFAAKAPRTVANFVGLATGKKPWTDPTTGTTRTGVKFYDGLTFHRVIPGFMIQGGDPRGNGTGGPGYQFVNETSPDLHHVPGALSMANSGPDTNGSQFFITEADTSRLDGSYSVFGQCAELDVIKAIGAVDRDTSDRPTTPVTIDHVTFSRRK